MPTRLVDPLGLQANDENNAPDQLCESCKLEVWCRITAMAEAVGQTWRHCYIKLSRCDGTEDCISGNPTNTTRVGQGFAPLFPFGDTYDPDFGNLVNDPKESPCEGGEKYFVSEEACQGADSYLCDCISQTAIALSGKYKYSLDPGKWGRGANSNTYIAQILGNCLSARKFTMAKHWIPSTAVGFWYTPKPSDAALPPEKPADPTRYPNFPWGY
jgi:hypothetical protein